MSHILIALFVFVLVGLALTYWLRHAHARQTPASTSERNAELLAKLHWREFTRLVLQAMHGRGYAPVIEDGMPADGIPTDGSDILLARGSERALLSCKYGSASVVGATSLLGLAKSATLRGAGRAIVITPGRFDDEAIRLAQEQDIELIDGEALWPEVRPYVTRNEAATPPPSTRPAAPAAKALAWAWGGAAAVGLLVWGGMQLTAQNAAAEQDLPPSVLNAAHAAKPAAAPATPAMDAGGVPTDPKALDQRRKEVAQSIATLFGISRALWSTQSTLMVYLSTEEADPMSELCPLLERYPELAASRVQLQPPAGSAKPVRFKQCRTY